MHNPRLASRYAKSLLDLAVEQNSVEVTLHDMELIDAICRQSPEFKNMLSSPIIAGDKKQRIVEAVVQNKIHELTTLFIKLLVNKNRESNLPEIAAAFIWQYKEMKNIKTVKLTTATPVSDAVKQEIVKKITAYVPDATIELIEVVNPDIIGGFILNMDDKLVDVSIRRDLNDIKAQFRKNIYVSTLFAN